MRGPEKIETQHALLMVERWIDVKCYRIENLKTQMRLKLDNSAQKCGGGRISI